MATNIVDTKTLITSQAGELLDVLTAIVAVSGRECTVNDNEGELFAMIHLREHKLSDGSKVFGIELDNGRRD